MLFRLKDKVSSFLCVLMFMCYTVGYFTGVFYAVARHISMYMLFKDNKDSVFCILTELRSLIENKYLGICQKDDRRECSD